MLKTDNLLPGNEQYEQYRSPIMKKDLIQYDYRAEDGELFSCIRANLEKCREARDIWLQNKSAHARILDR